MARYFFGIVGTAALWLVLASTAFVQAKPSGGRFDINGYAMEGSPLLTADDFSRIVAPFIGKRKTAADVQKARQALQQAYLDLGHCSAQVTVPKKQPDTGTVTLHVVQARTPVSKNCLPMMVLKKKRTTPVAVAVRPFAGVMPGAARARPPSAGLLRVAHAPAGPLLDSPATAVREDAPLRVAQATAAQKPAAKPPPVVVQAPAVAASTASATPVEAAAGAALKFDIDRYVVEGNTLLKADVISKALRSFTGKGKDFGDVQHALEALQGAYQKAGYGAVLVSLPEQELERGEVRFEVFETRIGKIDVEGNQYFSKDNIRRSVPSLKEGATPNTIAISRSQLVANENPAKQTQVTMKPSGTDGVTDVSIKVADTSPRKYSVSFDNSGTSSTGRFRSGFGFQHSNLWDRDHQLTVQYVTNPEHPSDVTIFGAAYHVPLYGSGNSFDLVFGYSNVDAGTVQQIFNVSGAGLLVLGRYNQNLTRVENYEHKITYGIDYKAFSNQVTPIGNTTKLVPDITEHPISVTYSGIWRSDLNDLNFYAGINYHPFPGGNDDAPSDFKASRGCSPVLTPTCTTGATAQYTIWRYGGVFTRLLPYDWTFRMAVSGQSTSNQLIAPEQFGVGGANSVRGFIERQYANDKGHQASFELYTPDFGAKFRMGGVKMKLLAFYDTASLSRNFIQPAEQTGLGVDSVGLGFRLSVRDRLNMRVDYAQVLHDGGGQLDFTQPQPNGRRNSNTLHAAVVLVF